MDVKGKIKVIMDAQVFDSGFQKREFVVTTEETYPQDLKMELIKDKCALLDNFKVNDSVNCSINLRGNEYNGKYYVNLQAWKIEAGTVKESDTIEESTEVPFQMEEMNDRKGVAIALIIVFFITAVVILLISDEKKSISQDQINRINNRLEWTK